MTNISSNLRQIKADIETICRKVGRPPDTVKLLAVSKTRSGDELKTAMAAGHGDFGENYLQEALDKVRDLDGPIWHFIGAIQSNKTRDIAANFDWVHSVGSSKVARRLSEQRLSNPETAKKMPIQVLLQINLSGEDSKSGMTPTEASHTVDVVRQYEGIELRGLMTIPEASEDHALLRNRFSTLRDLKDELANRYDLPNFNELSMGMTQDYPIAIEEGATWIRIGTAIFGPRV